MQHPTPQGVRRVHLETVGSTNAEALELARAGERGPLWVTAGEQTGGRGRRGRAWVSPPGNLYASLLICDPAPVENLGMMPLVAGVALYDALAVATGAAASLALKWPNDVLLGGAKLAGLLLESERCADGRLALVIGCGVNCVSHPENTPYRATDLRAEGFTVSAEMLFAQLARSFAQTLAIWDHGRGAAAIRDAWQGAATGIGAPITVKLADSSLDGVFGGIGADGRLLLKRENGAVEIISAGDLFFKP